MSEVPEIPREGADLYARLGEPAFLAFVHAGEDHARGRLLGFRDAAAARGDARTAAVLGSVLDDEAQHAGYSGDLLETLGRRPVDRLSAARFALVGAWWRQADVIAGALFSLGIVALFPMLWVIGRWLDRREGPPPSGWRRP